MLYHMIIIILLSACCIDGSEGSIDIDKRLRGVPMSDNSEGNKFCFSFLENDRHHTGEAATTKVLGIYITTQESEPVQYIIRSGVGAVNRTGTVQPGDINRELYQHITGGTVTDLTLTPPLIANMIPLIETNAQARSVNDFTGIIVETVNSSQKISVLGFSDGVGSSDGFAAVPIFDVSSIVHNYRYSIFTGGQTSGTQAITGIVACDHIQAGDLTLQYAQSAFFFSPGGYFGFRPGAGPHLSIIAFEQYYTPIIAREDDLIGGATVVSTQPIGFMTGHECGEVPRGIITCDHFVEQVPPSYTWGYNFLVAPFHSRYYGYIIKILPSHDSNTDFKVFCVNDSNDTLTFNVSNYNVEECLIANRGVFNITNQSYCSIQSNKPIAVMQYAKGHAVDDPYANSPSVKTDLGLGDPAMVWVPSVAQYLNKYLISNEVNLKGSNFTSNGVYVTVLPECFNASAILDNDSPLEIDPSKWGIFYCDDLNNICGYSVSVDIIQGPHSLVHTNPSCSFSAVLFGWGIEKGYAYTAGFGMRPIAETFYSINAVPSCEELLVDIIVYRSGDLSLTSHIEVMMKGEIEKVDNVSFSIDESTQILPVNITNYLQDEDIIIIKLIQRNEVKLGTPSSLIITVNDNGTIEVTSSVPVSPTHCAMISGSNTLTEVHPSSDTNNEYTSTLITTSTSDTAMSTTPPTPSPVSVSVSFIITTGMIGLAVVLIIISMIILVSLSIYVMNQNKEVAKNSNRGIDNAMYGIHESQDKK